MKYYFIFTSYGKERKEEINAQHAREIQIGDDILLNEFFPETYDSITFATVSYVVFGKGVKNIYLTKKYKNVPNNNA